MILNCLVDIINACIIDISFHLNCIEFHVIMDKSWMDLPDRFGTRYTEGVEGFIVLASNHTDIAGRIRCPCRICNNRYYKQVDEVKDHLLDNGMDKHYTQWVHHGEEYEELYDDDDDVGADEGVVF